MQLERHLADWVRRHRLFAPGDRIGVAVSGGSDSVALLLLLHALAGDHGWQLAVAHFDHGWRPDSGADAGFVAGLAARLKLPFLLGHAGTPPGADIEQAARRQRYAFFRSLVEAGQLTRIATAHTLDDQAETVLLRLLRGAGPAGLAGVLPARSLDSSHAPGGGAILARPLLWARHEQLRAWLLQCGQAWREDPTNLDLKRRRNWVRHQLLPLMTSANPALVPRLGALAEVARAEEVFWTGYLAPLSQRLWTPVAGGLRAPRSALAAFPVAVQRRLLRDGIRRLQGHLRRVDFHGIEAVITALPAPARGPRQFPCGGAVCRLSARHLELHHRPAAAPTLVPQLPPPPFAI